MFMFGINQVVEAFVELGVGKVRRESEHCLSSDRDGVGDGFVGVARVPRPGPKYW